MEEHSEDNRKPKGYEYKKAVAGLVILLAAFLALPFVLPDIPNEPVNPDAYPDLDSSANLLQSWQNAGIDCVPKSEMESRNEGVVKLTIISKNGINEEISAYVGVLSNCVAEIYTSDTSKTIHLMHNSEGDTLTLNDFFTVWNKEMNRPGQKLQTHVNGKKVSDPGSIALKDGQKILLEYQML